MTRIAKYKLIEWTLAGALLVCYVAGVSRSIFAKEIADTKDFMSLLGIYATIPSVMLSGVVYAVCVFPEYMRHIVSKALKSTFWPSRTHLIEISMRFDSKNYAILREYMRKIGYDITNEDHVRDCFLFGTNYHLAVLGVHLRKGQVVAHEPGREEYILFKDVLHTALVPDVEEILGENDNAS